MALNKSPLREPLLPSTATRIAVDVSEPFVVVLNPRHGSAQWAGRRIVRVCADAGAGAASAKDPQPDPAPPRVGFLQKLAQVRHSSGAATPRASDIFWPSAGAFFAMAAFGYLDDVLAAKGLKFTVASFGAVSALLFTSPKAPASQVRACLRASTSYQPFSRVSQVLKSSAPAPAAV